MAQAGRHWQGRPDGLWLIRTPSVSAGAGEAALRCIGELTVNNLTDEYEQVRQDRGRKYLSIIQECPAYRECDHSQSGYKGPIIVDPSAHREHYVEEEEGSPRPNTFRFLTPVQDGGCGRRFNDLAAFELSGSKSFERLSEIYHVLLPRRIEGFGLKTKKWMVFEVDNISPNPPLPLPNQLDSELVLVSDADKASLRTVLATGEHPTLTTADFVTGKGEGKVFLLYGPPRTGKTLTVEYVATDTCRPLLSLTAQDIGLDEDIELKLQRWFSLASKWDAILLIDEADLFLEQRKEGNVRSNSLSIIFLKTMEYFKGILFLTTNRPGHIDDFFISRISCPIAYQDLSVEAKGKVVRKFARKFEETGTTMFDAAAISYLCANCEKFNGRQIRNVMQVTAATAEVSWRNEQRYATQHGRRPAAGVTAAAANDSQTYPGMVAIKMHHVKAAGERQTEFRKYLKSFRGRVALARTRSKQDYLSLSPAVH
ncbi:P-loop containing nucleoside triphosphate hydrolase protein [Apodospora peruviana]|uniref:P-loop containing nucleoside triphosphate hydrolase protein n=1 Tax=Apodospora peruviana TaxID=516989 RepID=A0AAE0IC20_9PEZI|nr:P-loop containing nucleoside triphosphate hydrolase protein [Apodospora peruviana]